MPLLEGLEALGERPGPGGAGTLAAHLHGRIAAGASFAEALESYEPPVSPRDIAMARAGEASGSLPDMLRAVVLTLEQREERVRRYLPRFVYLGVVVGFSLLAPVLFAFVRSGSVSVGGVALVLGAALCVPVFNALRRKGDFHFRLPGWRKLAQGTPWLGRVLEDLDSGRALVTAGHLTGAGLPLSEALRLGGETAVSEGAREDWREATERLDAKATVVQTVGALRVFDARPELRSRLAVGERSGAIDRTLRTVGQDVERECERRLDRALVALGVIMTLLAGAAVVVYAFSVLVAPLREIVR